MERRTCAKNDIKLDYKVTGLGANKPSMLLLNGLGATHLVWAPLVRILRETYHLVLWDYPGLGWAKATPIAEVSVATLAEQAAAILDDLSLETVHIVGWSLGVQVGFELGRSQGQRLTSVVGLCGLAGKPFEGLGSRPILSSTVVPEAVAWISERSDSMERLRTILSKVEGPSRWAKRLGLIDPAVDDLLFDAVIREFVNMDPVVYNSYLQASAAHNAQDVASSAPFPVLLMGGERDRFTSAARLARLAQTIPTAELFMVRGATHFLVLEYTDLVALKIRDFIEKRTAI
ncbi:MAG: alpha/beta hydrolase [Myxococcota bacterium]|jgi:pimeloyl-ACP methyl ester carboxylesterase|nr:alpha/beta hydrolase [Myxococcota bacterium]